MHLQIAQFSKRFVADIALKGLLTKMGAFMDNQPLLSLVRLITELALKVLFSCMGCHVTLQMALGLELFATN